jgi:hypothetical protein
MAFLNNFLNNLVPRSWFVAEDSTNQSKWLSGEKTNCLTDQQTNNHILDIYHYR